MTVFTKQYKITRPTVYVQQVNTAKHNSRRCTAVMQLSLELV